MADPQQMNCIQIRESGGPEVLEMTRRPVPPVRAGEIRIRVGAAGINRPDCIQRQGHYAPPAGITDIPGLEVAGTVSEIGANAAGWAVGDSVTALVAGGGYAEYVTAPVEQCLPVPEGLTMIEAAALPETFFTVWTNVFERGCLQAGETLLVHGGSSGIGTTAIQIASQLGARVMATAGSPEKCEACLKLGAERAVNYHDEDFVDAAKTFGDKGVNVILDMVGGEYIARNIKALAPDGRLVNIAFLQGSTAEINFMPVMLKRLTLTGSTLRPQPIARKGEIAAALRQRVWPLIAEGRIKPVVHQTFELSAARQAHELMESSQHIGKIVLTVGN